MVGVMESADTGSGQSDSSEKQDWIWKPTCGEGAGAALDWIKRDERLKRRWREIHGGARDQTDDGGSHSAG
jgi:hypothetical protein